MVAGSLFLTNIYIIPDAYSTMLLVLIGNSTGNSTADRNDVITGDSATDKEQATREILLLPRSIPTLRILLLMGLSNPATKWLVSLTYHVFIPRDI